MYVIYINDRPLTLLSSSAHGTRDRGTTELAESARKKNEDPTHLTALYNGKPRTLLNYADMLEKGSPKVLSVDIVADDLEQLWADFRSKYKWVPAAGGLVRNTLLDRYLFIFRRGSWDLPKGKLDEGEDEPTAAIREVREETGVEELRLGSQLPTTFHTYRNRKGKRVLKPTFWFAMETTQHNLVPETEEDIELAEWRSLPVTGGVDMKLYQSLKGMLEHVSASK